MVAPYGSHPVKVAHLNIGCLLYIVCRKKWTLACGDNSCM